MTVRWTVRAANDRGPQAESQGLSYRFGRCFCAAHRGIHRTPAPRLSHHELSSQKTAEFFYTDLIERLET